jgi:prolyl-tRNA synthetase
LPFDIAPVQIAFVLIEQSEELINYYQEIQEILSSAGYRCRLYNKNKRVNLNILQVDKEGCPFKIILGKEELSKGEITLVRRDNIERKITVNLEENNEEEQKNISIYEKYAEELSKICEVKKGGCLLGKNEPLYSIKRGFKSGILFRNIEKEKTEFQKYLSQKSTEFRDSHIFSVDNYSELIKKIEVGKRGLFLIPFCNRLVCEEQIKEKVSSYSIRCIIEKKKLKPKNCLFCQSSSENMAYLGRSY